MKFFAILVSVAVSGCADAGSSAAYPLALPEGPSAAGQAVLATVEGECTINVPCEVNVVISSTDGNFGAYQGRLRLDSRYVRFQRPPTSGDPSHLVNPVPSDAGEVRFAGFSAAGERRAIALTATVVVIQRTDLAAIRVELDVAATPDGVRIPASGIATRSLVALRTQ